MVRLWYLGLNMFGVCNWIRWMFVFIVLCMLLISLFGFNLFGVIRQCVGRCVVWMIGVLVVGNLQLVSLCGFIQVSGWFLVLWVLLENLLIFQILSRMCLLVQLCWIWISGWVCLIWMFSFFFSLWVNVVCIGLLFFILFLGNFYRLFWCLFFGCWVISIWLLEL